MFLITLEFAHRVAHKAFCRCHTVSAIDILTYFTPYTVPFYQWHNCGDALPEKLHFLEEYEIKIFLFVWPYFKTC